MDNSKDNNSIENERFVTNSFTAVCDPKREYSSMKNNEMFQPNPLLKPGVEIFSSLHTKQQNRVNRAVAGRISRENERKAFEKLRQILPKDIRNPNRRMNRLEILKQTCEYMRCLEKMLKDLEDTGVPQ